MNGYTFCNSKNVFCVKEIVRVVVFCPRDFWGGFGTFLGGSNISMGSEIIDFMHKKGSIFIDFIDNWPIGIINWPIQTLKKGQKMVFLGGVKRGSKMGFPALQPSKLGFWASGEVKNGYFSINWGFGGRNWSIYRFYR